MTKATNIHARTSKNYLLMMLLGTSLLSGCATMSEEECLTADWRMIGYEDGVAGLSAARIGEHRKACAKHNLTPNMQAYRDGREEGLYEYCRPQNGFHLGQHGSAYTGVCPFDTEENFIAAYSAGKEIYDVQSNIRHLMNKLRKKENELEQMRQDIKTKTLEIASNETPNIRRVQLVVETSELAIKQDVTTTEIHTLKHKVSRKREQLAKLKKFNAYRY